MESTEDDKDDSEVLAIESQYPRLQYIFHYAVHDSKLY